MIGPSRRAITSRSSSSSISSATPPNVVFIGPNGVGKTMLAQNLALHALVLGHSARFVSASAMLTDLAAQDGALALRRRLRRFAKPELLVVDEVGYLSYSDRASGHPRRHSTAG
ncbi:ATP-binding protein [Nannocystis pusilla]|uniref:ATP-binding protein n=1 Tax=Nannocystis pusilla TaxID=889268 RepID=UPI003B76E201